MEMELPLRIEQALLSNNARKRSMCEQYRI